MTILTFFEREVEWRRATAGARAIIARELGISRFTWTSAISTEIKKFITTNGLNVVISLKLNKKSQFDPTNFFHQRIYSDLRGCMFLVSNKKNKFREITYYCTCNSHWSGTENHTKKNFPDFAWATLFFL